MILMNDFKSEPVELRQAMCKAANRVIESGWYILGNELINFEKLWSSRCGVDFGVGVGNGMDAIEIILRSLGIGVGDEVITTPMTAFATVLAIFRAGATPVLADIQPDTGLLSVESAKRCITSNTKAILLVHLYGQVRAMTEWQKLCADHGIRLIEDCAQAHLAATHGKVAGSFGVAGAYSFYPTKNLGALGDAGMLVTNDKALVETASRLRNYGQSVRYHHPEIGLNSRLDEIQAAMLVERNNWLTSFTSRRIEIARAYREGIKNDLIVHLAEPEEATAHVYHLYVVLSKSRDAIQKYLHDNGVQTLIHYPIPIHKQLPCRDIRTDHQGLLMSELHSEQCLSLPCHPQMTDGDVLTVINLANSFEA